MARVTPRRERLMSKNNETEQATPRGRRAFLGQLAAGAAAGAGVLALSGVANAMPNGEFGERSLVSGPDPEHWLDGLKAKHKQVVDAYSPNEGWPLAFSHTFLATNAPKEAGAVLVLRHFAMPIALQDSVWAKYKIGPSLKIADPSTKEIATRNPFLKPPHGALLVDDMSIDRLLQRGVFAGACSVALAVLSGMFAANAGVSADQAKAEWTAGILPGVTLLPSGVWGVNRAQEHGCTYVTGGG
jgi:hypothetical protein